MIPLAQARRRQTEDIISRNSRCVPPLIFIPQSLSPWIFTLIILFACLAL